MKINLTFVLQLINFFVTYYMLHALLLRPLLAVIRKERSHEHGLREKLRQTLSRVRARKREQKEALVDFQESFEAKFTLEPLSTPSIDANIGYTKDQQQISQQIDRVKTLIVSRLPHVD